MEQEGKQDHRCGAIVRIEDGGLGSIKEDMVDVKKRKFNDVDLQDNEQGLSSSSLSGSCCSSSSSGTEEEDNLKKKAKFVLEKVDEEEEEDEEDEYEDEEDNQDDNDDEESDEEEVEEEESEDGEEEDDLEEEEAEEGSTFTSEEVQKVELKPEEYAYEPSEEEKKYYESAAYRARPIILKSTIDEGSMDYHFMTERELQFFKQMIKESEGFDVPLIPGAVLPGGQVPNNLSDKGTARYIAKISKLALKYYNQKHGTDYALKCLVKSNGEPCNLVTYYITFNTTSGVHSSHNLTFQAKVYRGLRSDIQVLLCRIKSDFEQPRHEEEVPVGGWSVGLL